MDKEKRWIDREVLLNWLDDQVRNHDDVDEYLIIDTNKFIDVINKLSTTNKGGDL